MIVHSPIRKFSFVYMRKPKKTVAENSEDESDENEDSMSKTGNESDIESNEILYNLSHTSSLTKR